jgi:hypothetical protein
MMDLQAALLALRSGSALVVPPGVYGGGLRLDHKKNIALIGEGVTITGGTGAGLKASRCPGLRLVGLTFAQTGSHGVHAVFCDGLQVQRCRFLACRGSGLLTGTCAEVLVEECEATGALDHGIYLSEGGDHPTVRNCYLHDNTRAGLHVNGAPVRVVWGGEITGNRCTGNHGAGIQLSACRASVRPRRSFVVARNDVSGSKQGVVVYDDGRGDRWASAQIDLTGQSGPFNVARNSRHIRLPVV